MWYKIIVTAFDGAGTIVLTHTSPSDRYIKKFRRQRQTREKNEATTFNIANH